MMVTQASLEFRSLGPRFKVGFHVQKRMLFLAVGVPCRFLIPSFCCSVGFPFVGRKAGRRGQQAKVRGVLSGLGSGSTLRRRREREGKAVMSRFWHSWSGAGAAERRYAVEVPVAVGSRNWQSCSGEAPNASSVRLTTGSPPIESRQKILHMRWPPLSQANHTFLTWQSTSMVSATSVAGELDVIFSGHGPDQLAPHKDRHLQRETIVSVILQPTSSKSWATPDPILPRPSPHNFLKMHKRIRSQNLRHPGLFVHDTSTQAAPTA